MAFSRAYLYAPALQRKAHCLKALGHPERLSILMFLKSNGPQCVSAIAKNSPLRYKAVSQHLAILRRAQLVSCVEAFPFTFYSLSDNMSDEAHEIFDMVMNSMRQEVEY